MSAQQLVNLKLTDEDVHQEVHTRMQTYGGLSAREGYRCTRAMVLDVVLQALVTQETIESVCADLADSVCGETVRQYLNEQLTVEDLWAIERRANQGLVANLPRRLWNRGLEIAFDFHDEPFYGHSPELLAYTCRGPAKHGTTHFFRLATAYVIWRGVRVTVALLFVFPEDDVAELVAALLRRLRILELRLKRLYFDKGFCAIPVLRYVKASGWAAIFACPIRGKTGGTRALCRGRKSYRTTHTFASQAYGDLTVPVVITRTYTTHRRSRRGQRQAVWLVFVVLNAPELRAQRVRQLYKHRFGVETSYRCIRQVRARTTSRNAALRFWLLGWSVVLVNIWVELRLRFTQIKRQRGPRQLATQRLPLRRVRNFIRRAIERRYGTIAFIVAEAAPIGV
jgi:putative transposase